MNTLDRPKVAIPAPRSTINGYASSKREEGAKAVNRGVHTGHLKMRGYRTARLAFFGHWSQPRLRTVEISKLRGQKNPLDVFLSTDPRYNSVRIGTHEAAHKYTIRNQLHASAVRWTIRPKRQTEN